MAHRKGAGSTKNVHDSQPKYLGIKLADGATAKAGAIIVRQRGTKFIAGENVGIGKDHSLYALKDGTVAFSQKRKKSFDNTHQVKKMVSVV